MKRAVICLVVILSFLQATFAEGPEGSVEELPDSARELTPEELESLLREMEENDRRPEGRERRFVVVPPGAVPDENPPRLPGKWKDVDGARICEGYLTRIADDEFCSAEIPSDWKRFEFDGKSYYVAPTSE